MIDPATPLRGLRLAVLDTETTGLDPATEHVVEVAVVHLTLGADDPRLVYSTRVRPPIPIPEKVSQIHGITDADVADAPTWAQIAGDLAGALEDRVVCAHNAPFDYRMVRAENHRCGRLTPPWPWLCTQVPGKEVDRFERSKRLADVAARRGIALDAHGAAGDAMTAALVGPILWRDALRGTGVRTLGELLDWQHRTALEQEREFVAYLLRRGAKGSRPDCHWHEIEGVGLPSWPEPKRPAAPCPACQRPVTTAIGKSGAVELRDEAGVHDCQESRLDPQPRTPGLFP